MDGVKIRLMEYIEYVKSKPELKELMAVQKELTFAIQRIQLQLEIMTRGFRVSLTAESNREINSKAQMVFVSACKRSGCVRTVTCVWDDREKETVEFSEAYLVGTSFSVLLTTLAQKDGNYYSLYTVFRGNADQPPFFSGENVLGGTSPGIAAAGLVFYKEDSVYLLATALGCHEFVYNNEVGEFCLNEDGGNATLPDMKFGELPEILKQYCLEQKKMF